MPERRVAVFGMLKPSTLGDPANEMSYDSVTEEFLHWDGWKGNQEPQTA